MTTDYFRDLLLTQIAATVMGFMLLSTAAGLAVAAMKSAVRRASRSSR